MYNLIKINSILLLTILMSYCKESEIYTQPLLGESLPNTIKVSLKPGQISSIADLYKNKSLAIIYYSPVCPYSASLIKNIYKNRARLTQLEILFITSTRLSINNHKIKTFGNFKDSKNIHFAIDLTNTVSKYFHLKGYPLIAIYNKNGILKKIHTGSKPAEYLLTRHKEIIGDRNYSIIKYEEPSI